MSIVQQLVLAQRGRPPRTVVTDPVLTLDPSGHGSNTSLSGGDLTATFTSVTSARATAAFSSGVHWVECELLSENASYPGHFMFGLSNSSASVNDYPGQTNDSIGFYGWSTSGGGIIKNGNIVASGATFVAGDILNALIDADDKTVKFYKNGAVVTAAFNYGYASAFVVVGGVFSGVSCRVNFGATSLTYSPPSTVF